ncbi:MAG: hypothetical protein ACRC4G_05440 [Alphaproteobacteria bacterium]
MKHLKSLFVFFALSISVRGAEGSWEEAWESAAETESIDAGDMEAGDTSDMGTGDTDASDTSGEENAGNKKSVIENSAKARTKEALKGFLEDAFESDE